METVYGVSNWKLTVQREKDHVVILRAQTCDRKAILPDELFGLPITVLDKHALAPDAAPVKGEELRIVCGREAEWNNRNLQDLTLPAYLTEVRNYAFYGCSGLHTLRLHDRADHWGGGCLVNCTQLRKLHINRIGNSQGKALAFLCGEIHDELDVSIYNTDGSVARLLFPGFAETYVENFANHFFDYSIAGGGYPYHHVFIQKQLSLRSYDELWSKYTKEQFDSEAALRLAYMRLRWPYELDPFAEKQYCDYLRCNAAAVMVWQLSQKDSEGLSLLLDKLQPDDESLRIACDRARREQHTEALALLLEKQNKSKPRGFDKDFDL